MVLIPGISGAAAPAAAFAAARSWHRKQSIGDVPGDQVVVVAVVVRAWWWWVWGSTQRVILTK